MSKKTKKIKFRLAPPGYRYKWWQYALPMLLNAITGYAIIVTPEIVSAIINDYSYGNFDGVMWPLGLLIIITLFIAFNEKVTFGMVLTMQFQLMRDWREYVFKLIRNLPKKSEPGEIIAVITKDSTAISHLVFTVPDITGSLIVAVVGTIQLWQISPAVALAGIGGITATILLITLLSKIVEKRGHARREITGINAAQATDIATSLRTIAGLGAAAEMLRRYRKSAFLLRDANLTYRRATVWTVGIRLTFVGLTVMLAVYFALQGQLLNGVWVTNIEPAKLVTVVGTVTLMVGPVWAIEMFILGYRDAKVALQRIAKLEQQRSMPQITPTVKTPASMSLEQRVCYVDPRTQKLSAQEFAEQLTENLRELYPEKRVLLSQSNPIIFGGTLRDNLTLGAGKLHTEQLIWLLEATDSLEIAWRLGGTAPAAYLAAEISSEGANLSGGQRQRLALARALAQKVDILVLAEPLNSVDEPSQKYIFDRLEQAVGREDPLQNLERIYVVSTTAQAEQRLEAQARKAAGYQQEGETNDS